MTAPAGSLPPRRALGARAGEAVPVLAPRRPGERGAQEGVPVLVRRAASEPSSRPRRDSHSATTSGPWSGIAAALVVIALMWVGYNAVSSDRFASAIVMAPLFLGAAAALAFTVGRRERSFDLSSIMLAGAALRLIAEVPRQQNASDAAVYHDFAKQLSASFRSFQFDVDVQREFIGTGFLRYLTGLVQVVTFDDRYATFLVFTGFSMVAATFFYFAFARAIPDGRRQLYAALVFLWPSVAYWPSSIGKEAWMLLWIGVASYGAARVLTNRTLSGFVLIIAGLVGTSFVRPHVSLMILAATAVAVLVRKPQSVTSVIGGRTVVRRIGGGAKVLAVVLVLVGGGFLATQTSKVLRLDDSSADNVGAGLSATEAQTSQGGSAFTPFTVRNPANYPPAFVTVVFRPFPFEAHNFDSMQSAAEGVTLAVLLGLSLNRLVHLPSTMRRRPYLAYAGALVLVFVYAFSAVGNFGILARQRTQALPLVFVLVCLPAAERATKAVQARRRTAEPDEPGDARAEGDDLVSPIGRQRDGAGLGPRAGASAPTRAR